MDSVNFPPPVNRERFERLRLLSPLAAVRVWLNLDFGWGDERALIEAIRRDPRIKATDRQIEWFFIDEIEDGRINPPMICLEMLARLKPVQPATDDTPAGGVAPPAVRIESPPGIGRKPKRGSRRRRKR